MLIPILITLTLALTGVTLGFFALQARLKWWRLAAMERTAFARWSRMTALQKKQALKKIGVYPMQRFDGPVALDESALDFLFDGVLATAREELRQNGALDCAALGDELTAALEAPSTPANGRLAHG